MTTPARSALGPLAQFMDASVEDLRKQQQRQYAHKRVAELEERKRELEAETREKKKQLKIDACLLKMDDPALKDELNRAEMETNEARKERDAARKEARATLKASHDVGEDREEDEDKWHKHRSTIEALIETPAGFDWSKLQGQPGAVEMARRFVNSINRNYTSRPPGGLLLTGPAGVGKTTLAKIMASEMDCTFFNVPGTFARSNTELWTALFGIAAEKTPSIIFMDECDGVMSTKHTAAVPAIKQLWNPTADDTPFVLVLGATNKPGMLEKAILSRFGDPIEFYELGSTAIRAIIEGHIKAPFVLDLNDTQWDTLLEMTAGQSGRWIEAMCRAVQLRVEDECYGTTIRSIALTDFEAQIATVAEESMPGDAKAKFVNEWCMKHFDVDRYREGYVISLRYMIGNLLKDDQLRALGAKDVKQLRKYEDPNNRFPIKSQEPTFLNNITECLQATFRRCERNENSTGDCLEIYVWIR